MIFYFKILINSIIRIFTVHFPKFLDSIFNPKDLNDKDMEKSNKFFRFIIVFTLSIITLVFLIGNITYMVQIGNIVIYSETKVETKYPELKYNSSEYNKLVNQYKNECIESSDCATAEIAKILKDSIFKNMELYDIYSQLQFFVLTSCLLNFFAIIIFFGCLIFYFIMTEDNYLSETKYRLGFNKISDDEEYLILHNPALKYHRCFGNDLRSLDLSGNPALTDLDCSMNFSLTAISGEENVIRLSAYSLIVCSLIPRADDMLSQTLSHKLLRYVCVCRRFASLIDDSIYGSTALLKVPTLIICISTPILSSNPL